MTRPWRFWIDRGGAYTDGVARRPDGALVTHKLLSENPERYRDAAMAAIRELLGARAREPPTAAILSGHRHVWPHGMAGGFPGSVGSNWVERVEGARVQLDGADKTEMTADDVFVIETPGGGGYGTPA